MRAAAGEDRRSQLLRGVLDMCLLALLSDEEAYGYEVTSRLADIGLHAKDGSIYPLLARLERASLVSARTQSSESGPPRKYYRTTALGRRQLHSWQTQWLAHSAAVDAVLANATI